MREIYFMNIKSALSFHYKTTEALEKNQVGSVQTEVQQVKAQCSFTKARPGS